VARVEVKVPLYGMTESESYLVAWLVQPGDEVDEGAELAEVETNKAAATIVAPVAGTVGELQFEPESDIPVGAALTWIQEATS